MTLHDPHPGQRVELKAHTAFAGSKGDKGTVANPATTATHIFVRVRLDKAPERVELFWHDELQELSE